MGSLLGLKSLFNSLSGLDIFGLSLLALFILVGVPHLFLYWLVKRASADGFSAELRVPSILHFKIKPIGRRRIRKKASILVPLTSQSTSVSFGEQLKRLRIERRITLHQLGRALDLKSAEISKLENGSINATPQLIDGIGICLELSEQELTVLKAFVARDHAE